MKPFIVLTFIGCEDDPDDEDHVPSYSVTREGFGLGADMEIIAGNEILGYYHESYGLWYSTFTGKYYTNITIEIGEI